MAIDLKKELAGYTAPVGGFEIIDLPPRRYLMIDGEGDPNTAPAYRDALATLYPAAYALRAISKRVLDRVYIVPPLEALWHADDPAVFVTREKDAWEWTVLSLVPDWLDASHVDEAVAAVARKGVPLARVLRSGILTEGLCVQTLHIGPYDAEGPVLARMHDEFIPAEGLRMTGDHHEIYLGDPRRAAPEKLRTILRQPVERV